MSEQQEDKVTTVTEQQSPKTPVISRDELRFVEYWKEQRKGAKYQYYLLYSIGYGFVITLFAFFIIMFLGGISIIPIAQDNHKVAIIILAGLATGIIFSIISRSINEKKYFRILGKVRDNIGK